MTETIEDAARELDRLRRIEARVRSAEDAHAMVVAGMNAAAETIMATHPKSLAEAAVKLRLLLSDDMGFPAGDRCDDLDMVALDQVAELLEAMAAGERVT
jgi:hypothetical protein